MGKTDLSTGDRAGSEEKVEVCKTSWGLGLRLAHCYLCHILLVKACPEASLARFEDGSWTWWEILQGMGTERVGS